MIVEKTSNKSVGMIDLFDFNPQHHRAGIGIIIDSEFQGSGFALEALQLLIQYGFTQLNFTSAICKYYT